MPYGYWTSYGYLGRVGERFVLFASDSEYLEYLKEN